MSTAPEVFSRRIMGVETEYGLIARTDAASRPLSPEETARELFRPLVARYASSNIFLPNAARLYLDVGAHPEYATAECDSLSQLIAQERAGDRIVDDLAQRAEAALAKQGHPATIYLFKNNVDSAGNSYGCHENYLLSRQATLKDLGRRLLAFMVTRQILCGAGWLVDGQFRFSQRADHVWEGISSATTRSRPIINTRDEPHSDSSRFRRMHVIVGDSSMAEPTAALKYGSTLLMLEMLEAEVELPVFDIGDPIAAIRALSRDLSAQTILGEHRAWDIQYQLSERAQWWLQYRDDSGTDTAELARVVELWQRTLACIASGDYRPIATEIDWAIKYQLLQRYADQLGSWDHPKLAQVDLTYHDIRPGRGLASVLERRGLISRWITDDEISQAQQQPPASTRAALRGKFISRAQQVDAAVTVDWVRLKLNRPEPLSVELLDPFDSSPDLIASLLSELDTVQDPPLSQEPLP